MENKYTKEDGSIMSISQKLAVRNADQSKPKKRRGRSRTNAKVVEVLGVVLVEGEKS
jgi:hypothetical protein